jgi:ATP-dependent DNA ligase
LGQEPLPLIRPMLAVNSLPFDSDLHLFEIKWDGYRGLLYLDGNTALRSRNLLDLTGKFPELGRLHQKVARKPAILDGEIVVFEKRKTLLCPAPSPGQIN